MYQRFKKSSADQQGEWANKILRSVCLSLPLQSALNISLISLMRNVCLFLIYYYLIAYLLRYRCLWLIREREKKWGSGLSSHFHSTHVTKISHHSTNQMSFVMTSALSVYRHLPTYIQCARARGGYYLSTMTRFMYLSILSKEF